MFGTTTGHTSLSCILCGVSRVFSFQMAGFGGLGSGGEVCSTRKALCLARLKTRADGQKKYLCLNRKYERGA